MTRWSWRWLHRLRAPLAVITTAMVVGAFGAASAASLGGLSTGTIFTTEASVTNAAPAVLACDDFTLAAVTGTALNNRPAQLPTNCVDAVWTVHSGAWSLVTGQVQANTNDSSASVAAGGVDVSAQTTVLNANAANSAAGVAIDHSGASQVFLAGVVASGNVVQLRLVDGTTVTTLASATASVGASAVVRLTRQATTVTLRVNGAVALTFTLTPAQVTTLTGTRTGLYWSRGNSVRFTDFLATQASP